MPIRLRVPVLASLGWVLSLPAQDFEWIQKYQPVGGSVGIAISAQDPSGGIYVAHNSNGDVAIKRYTAAGTLDGNFAFGSPGMDLATGIAAGPCGDSAYVCVFVAGRTNGSFPGYTNLGGQDLFVAKIHFAIDGGHLDWVRQLGTGGDDLAYRVAVGADGFYIGGKTAIPATLPSGWMLEEGVYSPCAFVSKFDTAGTHLWTRLFSTPGDSWVAAVVPAVEAGSSVIYSIGVVLGTFVGETGSLGGVFVRKYNAGGDRLWTTKIFKLDLTSLLIEPKGAAVYGTDLFVGGTTIAPLPGQTYTASWDAFAVRFATASFLSNGSYQDIAGSVLWTRQFQGAGTFPVGDAINDVAVNSTGIFFVGRTDGVLPGQTGSGDADAFLRIYNPAGDEVLTGQFGSDYYDLADGIVLDVAGNAYLSGFLTNAFPGTPNPAGGFVAKFTVATTVPVTVTTVPSGLTITVDGAPDQSPKSYNWSPGDHTISADDPQQVTAISRSKFSNWSDGGSLTHTVAAPASPATYTATFTTQYLLTTAASPPGGGSITAGGWFDSGSSVPVTATPAAGYEFVGFSGSLSGTVNPASVLMSGARSVTANFKASTASGLAASPNPAVFGQSITLTATVTSAAGTPTGSVAFTNGAGVLGVAPLTAAGQAVFAATSLGAGSHSITAIYGGDSTFVGSSSSAIGLTVNPAATAIALASTPNPSAPGQNVSLTATVTSATGAVPIGSVAFREGSANLASGTLDAQGKVTVTVGSLSTGTHNIKAVYAGTVNFSASSSPAVKQVVSPASTTTAIVSSLNPSPAGQTVTFTATVLSASGPGTPTGAVTFKDGGKTLGAGMLDGTGHCSFSTSALKKGSHTITATYSGDANYSASKSADLIQTVN